MIRWRDRGPPPSTLPKVRARGAGCSYALAAFLLLVPLLAATVAVAGFAAGIAITPLHLPAAVIAAAVVTHAVGRAEGLRRREVAIALATGVALLAVAIAMAHLSWDFSYDGQAYHQSTIRQLMAGWNPLKHALTDGETIHGLWLNHYVRAVELGAATIAVASGSLEAGKAFGGTLLVAAALLAVLALRRAAVRRGPAVFAAAIAVSNPIVLAQLPTFYVDGQLALAFACSVALAWISVRARERTAPFLFAAALALLANVKFTGTVYAALLLAGYLAAVIRRGAPSRRAWLPVVVATSWALAIGWQPLVTNLVDHGHPFYPVAGPGRVDGLSGQTPWFRHRDPLRRLLESTFSESNAARAVPVPKLPFVVREREIAAMEVADVRIGGFGPLFALGLVFAVLGLGLGTLPFSRVGRGTRAGLLVGAGVLATALVNPGAWWARFVPQIWLAVVVASIALSTRRGAARVFGLAALTVLAADAAVVATSAVHGELETHAAAVRQAHELAQRYPEVRLPRGEMESLDLRLARSGVRARYVARCAVALPLAGTYASCCGDDPGPSEAPRPDAPRP